MSALNLARPPSSLPFAGGFCCQANTAPKAKRVSVGTTKSRLLGRSIIALPEKWPEYRHIARLHQRDLEVMIFSIMRLALRDVAQNVLIAKLHADFRGNVGQFVQIIHRV